MKCPARHGPSAMQRRLTIDYSSVNENPSPPLPQQTQARNDDQQHLQPQQLEYTSVSCSDGSFAHHTLQEASYSYPCTQPEIQGGQAPQASQEPVTQNPEQWQAIYDASSMQIDNMLSNCYIEGPEPSHNYTIYPRTDSNITTVGTTFNTQQSDQIIPEQPDHPPHETAAFANGLVSTPFMSTYERVTEFIEELPVTPRDLHVVKRIGSAIEWTDRAFPSQYHFDNQQSTDRWSH